MIDLHCHLNGLITPSSVGASIAPGSRSDFFATFEAIDSCFCTLGSYTAPLLSYLLRVRNQPIERMEIIVPAHLFPPQPERAVTVFRQFVSCVESSRPRDDGFPELGFNFGCSRFYRPKQLARKVEVCLALREAGLIGGFDLSGREEVRPASFFLDQFRRLHAAGIPCSIHAGEWLGAESVWDALRCRPQRLGHAISAFEDADLVREIRERGVHVEMCLSSNLWTGSVNSLSRHPLRLAFDAGLCVNINTDDPGVFGVTPRSENEFAAGVLGFSAAELQRMNDCARSARFDPGSSK